MTQLKNTYLALLRGINVGGKNLIKMAELKLCFERLGFEAVVTYIQSGNVIFRDAEKNPEKLTTKIERALSKKFTLPLRVVVISDSQLKKIISEAPPQFGGQPAEYRYDVIFLKSPFTAPAALKEISTNPNVDVVVAGKGVLYFKRLIKKATQSRMSRIVALPMYQNMTIRNWNTTTKLLALMEK